MPPQNDPLHCRLVPGDHAAARASVVSTSIPGARKMHSRIRLSRGLRGDECDVVSNSQLKVDVSTSDPITPGFPVSPPYLDPPLLSPLAQLSTAHPLHSACSPNINSSRLCGIRNFPTVFSPRRSSDPSAVAPQTRAIIEKPSPLVDPLSPLLRRRSPRSFRPFHYETNQCFSLEKGSKRNSCSCTSLSFHSPSLEFKCSAVYAKQGEPRASVCLHVWSCIRFFIA